jgi:hypothetical protein
VEIHKITGLTDEAEKARDYLMKLPARMTRISERMTIPQESHIFFKMGGASRNIVIKDRNKSNNKCWF